MSFQTRKTFVYLSEHKLRYFWWNLRAFWPCIDSNAKLPHSRHRKIVRTSIQLSMWHQWFNLIVYAMGILFVCKENKIITFIQQFPLFCLSLTTRSWRATQYPFWALNVVVALLSMEVQNAYGFHQKYFNLCSEDERRSYGFRTTWGWVINDINFILG